MSGQACLSAYRNVMFQSLNQRLETTLHRRLVGATHEENLSIAFQILCGSLACMALLAGMLAFFLLEFVAHMSMGDVIFYAMLSGMDGVLIGLVLIILIPSTHGFFMGWWDSEEGDDGPGPGDEPDPRDIGPSGGLEIDWEQFGADLADYANTRAPVAV